MCSAGFSSSQIVDRPSRMWDLVQSTSVQPKVRCNLSSPSVRTRERATTSTVRSACERYCPKLFTAFPLWKWLEFSSSPRRKNRGQM
ncbi:hypothetical protein ACOSQ4_004528 [Xanthoceras sorbifolium]